LSEAGWSGDPLVRLSVAAQARQRDDGWFFTGPAGREERASPGTGGGRRAGAYGEERALPATGGGRRAGAYGDAPILWRHRGRVKLPLLPSRSRPCPAPIHGLRGVLRELPAATSSRALEIVEDAARGEAQEFEARALWPRILARLFAADLVSAAEGEAAAPAVQIVDGDDAAIASDAFREWSAAAEALRSIAGYLW